jgi:tetratricopeptide (TPR) repeat protein
MISSLMRARSQQRQDRLARARLEDVDRLRVAIALAVLLPAAAHAGPLEDCLQQRDNYRRIQGCTERIRQYPRDAVAYFNRGKGYLTKGELDSAIADNTKVIEIDPMYAAAYTNRGVAYGRKTQYERAIRDYDKAIKINPRYAWAYNARAWTYFKTGKAVEGLRDAERAVQLEPDNPIFVDTRGHTYEAIGRKEQAIADFRRALSIDPSMQSSKDGLKRLGSSP